MFLLQSSNTEWKYVDLRCKTRLAGGCLDILSNQWTGTSINRFLLLTYQKPPYIYIFTFLIFFVHETTITITRKHISSRKWVMPCSEDWPDPSFPSFSLPVNVHFPVNAGGPSVSLSAGADVGYTLHEFIANMNSAVQNMKMKTQRLEY